jgi:hypothetical protein
VPDFVIEVQAVGSPSPPEVSTTSQAVEISVTPAVIVEGGEAQDKNYYHTQAIPATDWTIQHNLGKYPSAAVIDTGMNRIFGDEEYVDENTMVLRFSVAFSGTATLN